MQGDVDSATHLGDRYRMIESIDITNFRGIKRLQLQNCAPINVIVGENGAGKTALFEAIFLTLGGNTGAALAIRQWRGIDGHFKGLGKGNHQMKQEDIHEIAASTLSAMGWSVAEKDQPKDHSEVIAHDVLSGVVLHADMSDFPEEYFGSSKDAIRGRYNFVKSRIFIALKVAGIEGLSPPRDIGVSV